MTSPIYPYLKQHPLQRKLVKAIALALAYPEIVIIETTHDLQRSSRVPELFNFPRLVCIYAITIFALSVALILSLSIGEVTMAAHGSPELAPITLTSQHVLPTPGTRSDGGAALSASK